MVRTLILINLISLQTEVASVQENIACPKLCACRNNEAACVHRGKGLQHIPPLPANIITLRFCGNFLPRLRNDTFYNVSKLNITKLILRDNRIHEVDKNAFRELPRLHFLDLSKNTNLNASEIRRVVYGLKDSAIQDIYLTKMLLANISDHSFSDIKTLQRLHLDDNLIHNFSGNLYSLPKSMKKISLKNNRISIVKFKKVMPNLEILILKENKLTEVPKFCLPHKQRPSFPLLKVLDLSDNFLYDVTRKNFHGQCLPNLKSLKLGHNKIKFVPENLIADLSTLQYLSVANLDHSVTFSDLSFNSTSLKTLYMANKFKILKHNKNIFNHSRSLKILDMTGIQFSVTRDQDRKVLDLLRPLTKLTSLTLKSTSLSTFPKALFSIMPNLTSINLQNCFFNESHLEIFKSSALEVLNLDHNLITTINESNIPNEIKNISLRKNPFMCTCDLVWFRDWIGHNSQQLLRWPSGYKCHLPQEWRGRRLADFHLSYLFCHPLSPYIILAISISFGGTFITCLSCLFYQKRWHIKYYLYLLRAKRRGYEILAGDEFAYDVFLAYNSNDRIWVISELIPKLEKEENLKLCLHDRDFQVGKLIVDNITDTMHRSRKVLIILSNSFAQSHWCRFETMLAQLRLINNGKETVIVVILENILTKNMTNSLHVLLKTITFIEWTNEKSGKEMFWNRLVAAVKS